MTKPQELSKEERILRIMKMVLTNVIKETAVPPGTLHPLSKQTINDMRECLVLIVSREQELAEAAGRTMAHRPRYVDDPKRQEKVAVPLHKTDLVKNQGKKD